MLRASKHFGFTLEQTQVPEGKTHHGKYGLQPSLPLHPEEVEYFGKYIVSLGMPGLAMLSKTELPTA